MHLGCLRGKKHTRCYDSTADDATFFVMSSYRIKLLQCMRRAAQLSS
jgi:hypothetical protein